MSTSKNEPTPSQPSILIRCATDADREMIKEAARSDDASLQGFCYSAIMDKARRILNERDVDDGYGRTV